LECELTFSTNDEVLTAIDFKKKYFDRFSFSNGHFYCFVQCSFFKDYFEALN